MVKLKYAVSPVGMGNVFLLSGYRQRVFRLLFTLQLFCASLAFSADSLISKEYQVKAAFLYNFTKFIEWPQQSFANDSSPIVIGILGENPFGGELSRIVAERKVMGREIMVTNITTEAEAKFVHMLFISEEARWVKVIESLQGHSVLTVGDSARFTKAGGVIGFTIENDKMRFEINQYVAEQAGLVISAQLLKLAMVVHKTP